MRKAVRCPWCSYELVIDEQRYPRVYMAYCEIYESDVGMGRKVEDGEIYHLWLSTTGAFPFIATTRKTEYLYRWVGHS